MEESFEQVTVAKAGAEVGTMRTAWGKSAPIIADTSVEVVRWEGTTFSETHSVKPSLNQGKVGTLKVHAPGSSSESRLTLQHSLPSASFWWRLTRH
jgi:hypothetical protein